MVGIANKKIPFSFCPHSLPHTPDETKKNLFCFITKLKFMTFPLFMMYVNMADPNGTQDACHNWTLYWPTSPKSLCDSVVEHRSWESLDIRIYSQKEFRIFPCQPSFNRQNSWIFFSHRRNPVPVSYHFDPLTSMSDRDRMTFLTISIQDQPDKWRE